MANSEFESNINLDDDKDPVFDYTPECDHFVGGDQGEIGVGPKKEESGLRDDEANNFFDYSVDEIMCREFGSEEEAYNFYRLYAKYHGFVVRRDDVTRDIRGNIIMRQFVCNREGLRNKKHFMRVDRKREHRPLTRTKCPAKLRIHYEHKSLKWIVVSFEQCHNHELTPCRFVHLHPGYRELTDADKAQVDCLYGHGLRGCHIMGYLVAQKGGYRRVGFTKKDMYNYLDRKNQAKIKKGDVRARLSYLQAKADGDPFLYGKYSTGSDGKLKRLFWADGVSRYDFHCFGDVLAFDTTYKKNKYNYPVVIFSGCNHHSQTIIFGCALVADETTETYKWVLEAFLDAMGNKQPKAVVTDGDSAMREAIKLVFPDSCHRLCAWHLHNNACENVKISPFLEDFNRAMYSNFTPEEFEDYWKKMIVEHGLVGNKWVTKTYENKELWATAYLRDKFFGRIRTTSQCESINSFIRSYCKKKSSMVEFLHKFEQAKKEYRNNELMAEFKTLFSEPVLSTYLRSIEKEASKMFTQEIFREVKQQIEKANALVVSERSVLKEKVMFSLKKYCNPGKETHVMLFTSKTSFLCDCRLFESRGIPCSHIITVMRNEDIDHIPESLICKRWLKTAKIDFMSHYGEDEIDCDVMEEACYASISAACNNFAKVASKKRNYLKDILEDIRNLTIKYEKLGDKVCTDGNPTSQHVGDPNVVKTKGAPKKKKNIRKRRIHCSNCSGTGHTIRRCPLRNGTHKKSKKDDDLSHSETGFNTASSDSEKDAMDSVEANEEETNLDQTMSDDKNSQQRDGQQKHVQFDCTRLNVDKAKDKIRRLSKKKEKSTSQEKKVKHAKEPAINPGGCYVGVKDVNSQVPSMVHQENTISQEKNANHAKEPANNFIGGSIGVIAENSQVPRMVSPMPMAPPMNFPINGYGSFSQGYPILPNFHGAPIQSQHTGVPFYSQSPQFPFYHQNSQLSMYPQGPQVCIIAIYFGQS